MIAKLDHSMPSTMAAAKLPRIKVRNQSVNQQITASQIMRHIGLISPRIILKPLENQSELEMILAQTKKSGP